MNYRHAYHAGNHADVLKHIVVARIIEHSKKKEAPFRLYDAHGGIGCYDLGAVEAEKTFEWREGVGRVFAMDGAPLPLSAQAEALIAPWRACITALNPDGALRAYPGSPEVARQLLRPIDRLRLNELHPVDHETLKARYSSDRRTAVTRLDALVFVKSQLPPPERRGLILIDPPYEKTDEVEQALRMLGEGLRRFATGAFVLWFPITGDGLDQRLKDAVAAMSVNALAVEMTVRTVRPDGGLAGSGMIIVNPPWTLKDELEVVAPDLAERLSQGDHGFNIHMLGA